MRTSNFLFKTLTPSRLHNFLLCLSLLFIAYLLLSSNPQPSSSHQAPIVHHPRASLSSSSSSSSPTSRRHLLFAIGSSSGSFAARLPYLRLWHSPNSTRAFAFLDGLPSSSDDDSDGLLPPTVISQDTSAFPYSFKGGFRSAIRLARVAKEIVDFAEADVRWFVFGDDDTVFFVDNLVKVLSKYDHTRWYYIGSNSESYFQNSKNSFEMAFGGGGFAISSSLAAALAKVLDSCLFRYSHLYGSDSRIFSCVAELGVGMTHEPGFHQVDMRGNLFGLLTAHPLSPMVSLHHLDKVDPIFPNMNRSESMEHLFKAVKVDPLRILQQCVCYDRSNSLTVSVSWGYAVQVFEGNELLPDLLSLQRTFTPWRRGMNTDLSRYMYTLRDYPRDVCKRPVTFFLESILSDNLGVRTTYSRQNPDNCARGKSVKNLKKITVFSRKLELDTEQMKAPRRQCCDILPIINGSMVIHIRECGPTELIAMHP
ncbi:hypothetical protein CRG98_037219 [Punica granatum]|uniref:Uncharacterized protein n=1 Tax=Punica granatum TaxID=22663 RepID=A0A2I0IEF2_PUNGR|nr:hypothetical protein CRG98_037219 [Punica granatum]